MFLILNKNSSAFLNSLTDNGEARIQTIEKGKGPLNVVFRLGPNGWKL